MSFDHKFDSSGRLILWDSTATVGSPQSPGTLEKQRSMSEGQWSMAPFIHLDAMRQEQGFHADKYGLGPEDAHALLKRKRRSAKKNTSDEMMPLDLSLGPDEDEGIAWGIYVTLLMSLIGGGMLSLPYAFKLVGVPVGLVLLCLTALVTIFTAELLLEVHMRTGKITYQEFGHLAFGHNAVLLFEGIKVVAIWGCCIGYMTISLGVLERLLPELGTQPGTFAHDNTFVTSFIYFVLVFPFCLMEDISSLRYSSYAGAFFSVYVIGLVGVDFFVSSKNHVETNLKATMHFPKSLWNVPVALGLFFFAYVLHLNVVPLYYTMRPKNPVRMRRTIRWVVATATIGYGMVGVFGYAHFLDATADNILFNFMPLGRFPYILARVSVCCIASTAFPLVFFPLRRTLEELFFRFIQRKDVKKLGPLGFIVEVGALMFLTFTIATAVPGIGVVFGFTGSTSVVAICFLFPTTLYLRIQSADSDPLDQSDVTQIRQHRGRNITSGAAGYSTFEEMNSADAINRRLRLGIFHEVEATDACYWKRYVSVIVAVISLVAGLLATYATVASLSQL